MAGHDVVEGKLVAMVLGPPGLDGRMRGADEEVSKRCITRQLDMHGAVLTFAS